MNHSGFVLEFDVDALKANFEEIQIRDVDYKDEPDEGIGSMLGMAAVARKPRHAVWLNRKVLSEAYFSKGTAWSYEKECRLVCCGRDIMDVSGHQILYVPIECVKSIIVGSKFHQESMKASKKIAKSNGVKWYESIIGRSSTTLFFSDHSKKIFIFSDEECIVVADNVCESCSEPISVGSDLCPWCSITEAHEEGAAMGNSLRMLDAMGGLDEYLAGVAKIERKRK